MSPVTEEPNQSSVFTKSWTIQAVVLAWKQKRKVETYQNDIGIQPKYMRLRHFGRTNSKVLCLPPNW